MTKRQREAYQRRQKIIRSPAFQAWWSARRGLRPIPSDPFRAFMIDVGLLAKPLRKEYWQYRTNRSDYPPVDLPRGVPRGKRRLPSRKEERRRYKRVPKMAKPIVETPRIKELKRRGEAFLEKYHLPAVEWAFVPERGEGISSVIHASLFGGRQAIVTVGTAGGLYPAVAALKHELGHHGHYAYQGLPEQKAFGVLKGYPQAGRVEREKTAWKIAELDLQKGIPIQKWTKKYYLGTYLGTSPRGRPKLEIDVSKAILVTPKKRG